MKRILCRPDLLSSVKPRRPGHATSSILRLCVLHKAAARMSQFRREDGPRSLSAFSRNLIARCVSTALRSAHIRTLASNAKPSHSSSYLFADLCHLFPVWCAGIRQQGGPRAPLNSAKDFLRWIHAKVVPLFPEDCRGICQRFAQRFIRRIRECGLCAA